MIMNHTFHCTFVIAGESVEENANLVIRLLIRRPECLGPALRGEGEGLLSAIESGNKMSEQIQQLITNGEAKGLEFSHPAPQMEDDEDWINTGAAVLAFYCTLVDLLGRCAPEASVIAQGKNDSLRARAILRSLVPLDDLQGVLSLRFDLTQALRHSLGHGHSLSDSQFPCLVWGLERALTRPRV